MSESEAFDRGTGQPATGPIDGQGSQYSQTQSQSEQTQSQTQFQGQFGQSGQQMNNTTTKPFTLYRHPTDKLVGGVCGGFAEYLGWDPVLVRILWLVATVATGGGGLLAYLVLWGLLPVGTVTGGVQQPATFTLNERNIGRIATILIGFGALWLLANLGILPRLWHVFHFFFGVFFWPALLIGIGYLLLRGTGNTKLNLNLDEWRKGFQSKMSNVKMPNGNGFKSGLNETRQRLPFRRSQSDRIMMGVCGGIGRRLNVDANLVRLLWVAFSIGSIGMGVFIYVALGLLLPEDGAIVTTRHDQVQDVEVVEGSKAQML